MFGLSKMWHKATRPAKRAIGLPVQADAEEARRFQREAATRQQTMIAKANKRKADLDTMARARRANIRNRNRGRGLLLYSTERDGLTDKLGG